MSLVFPANALAQSKPDTGRTLVLHRSGSWRTLYTWTVAQVRTGDTIIPRILKPAREVIISDMAGFDFLTAYPPADWAAPDFDDTIWPRQHFFLPLPNGETDGRAGGGAPSYYTRQISLRGKFEVADPAKVANLTLTLGYRGGVVVYVNGTELVRDHLPAGKLEAGAVADAYPPEVTLKADGNVISWYTDKDALAAVTPKRVRTLDKIAVPAKLLRPGRNVLAVEIHSAPYPDIHMNYRKPISWVECGLVELALEADKPDGLRPNVTRPAGPQAWNVDTLEYVNNVDWGDPTEPLKPIRLAVARNGSVTGRVAIGNDQPIADLAAAVSDLAGPNKATIPAGAIRVSYGAFAGAGANPSLYPVQAMRDDPLLSAAPKTVPVAKIAVPQPFKPGAVQSVAITVRVPKDAPPGSYTGELTVKSAGDLAGATKVPVELTVLDWQIPDPADFAFWVDLVQAPEGPACAYGETLWSDRHWDLIGKSFDWIAQVGSRVLFVPLTAQTELGNEEGMVRFTKGNDGKLTADLALVEKYLDVALKRIAKPRYVICVLWERCEQLNADEAGSPLLSVVDSDGKVTAVRGPKHATPESIELWKPVLTQIDASLTQRGLPGTLVLGCGDDLVPNEATVSAYRKILPNAGWYSGRHTSEMYSLRSADGPAPMMLQCNVYGMGDIPDPAVKRFLGWNRKIPVAGGQQLWLDRSIYDSAAFSAFHWLPEAVVMSDRPGLGCLGADFWPPLPGKGPSRSGTLFSRYPRSQNIGAGGKGITSTQYLFPAPDGPVPTLRFEAFRQGIQETEARIFLERLLKDKRLPDELAGKVQSLLDERARHARLMDGQNFKSALTAPYSGWQDRALRLFQLAAEAAKSATAAPPGPAVAPAPAEKP